MQSNEQMSTTPESLGKLARESQNEWLEFARKMIQIPSLPGEEKEVAACVLQEMQRLGYDRAYIDEVGNVIGMIRGDGGRSLMYNGHMDIVDPGPLHKWSHAPYAADVADGWLWGRGASDMKASLALEIFSFALLRRAGYTLPGDCYVSAVVFEERGGLGTRKLVENLKTDMAVVGEATANQIARGHRGRLEINVRFVGRSAHASAPERAINPHYSAARFLEGLRTLPMSRDVYFGPTTAAPTGYETDQVSANVIPGEVTLTLDWRNEPNERTEDALNKLRKLMDASLVDGCTGSVELAISEFKTYTGFQQVAPRAFPSFATPADHWLVCNAQRTLEKALGRPVEVGKWQFATDGAHLSGAGIPTIGFSPALEALPHTVEDRIEIEAMIQGLIGYMALALELGR